MQRQKPTKPKGKNSVSHVALLNLARSQLKDAAALLATLQLLPGTPSEAIAAAKWEFEDAAAEYVLSFETWRDGAQESREADVA